MKKINYIKITFLISFFLLLLSTHESMAGWTVITEDPVKDNGYIALTAINRDSAAVIGIANSAYILKRTDDGGQTWDDMTYTGELLLPLFMTIHFRDQTHGWMGGLGAIYYTEDGLNFSEVQIPGEWFGPIPLTTIRIVKSYSLEDGIAVGDSSSMSGETTRLFLTTNDGGHSWEKIETGINLPINGLDIVDDNHTWMIGANGYDLDGDDWPDRYDTGTIFFSDNRGVEWREVIGGLGYGLQTVDFLDEQRGWVIGTDGSNPKILITQDGGNSWSSIDPGSIGIPSDTDELLYIKLFSMCEIWLIGHRKAGDSIRDLFLHSIDGGNTFVEEFDYEGPSVMFAYDFADRTRGWAGGAYLTLLRYDAETGDPGNDCTFPEGTPVGVTEESEELVEELSPIEEEVLETVEEGFEEAIAEVVEEGGDDADGDTVSGKVSEEGCSCNLIN